MDILKKIFNFNKSNKKSNDKEDDNKTDNTNLIDSNIEIIGDQSNNDTTENIQVNNIEENKIMKRDNILLNKLKIWEESIIKNNIEEIYIKKLILKIESLINSDNKELGENEILELNQDIDNIIKREKLKNKKEIEIKIQSSEKLNNGIKELISLLNDFNGIIDIEQINIDLKYEEFLNSENYIYTMKIQNIINKIVENKLEKGLYNELGDMYKNYEIKAISLFKEINSLEKNISTTTKEIEEFANEVKNFTIYLNKISAKGKIELKNQYDKLQRGREVLINKEKVYKEKEEKLNKDVLDITQKIPHILIEFKEILEYILIFLDERTDEIQTKISTFTKEKNTSDSLENIKYEINILTELRNILEN